MMRLGIDFGTSFCTMCIEKNGNPEVLADRDGLTRIPSMIFWGEDGIRAGQAAMDMLHDCELMAPEPRAEAYSRIFRGIRNHFSADYLRLLPDGTEVSAEMITTEILKYLKQNAESLALNGTNIDACRIAHPVIFTQAQKQMLCSAAAQAGFSDVELIEGPVAAAHAYFQKSGDAIDKGLLVYDLGAGTLDLAYVLRDEDGTLRIPVAPSGERNCCGDDFDRIIYRLAEKQFLQDHRKYLGGNADTLHLPFLYECRRLKEQLSRKDSACVSMYFEDLNASCRLNLSREQFETAIYGSLVNSIALTEALLKKISDSGHQVDTAVLIGGSSRIPLVRRMIEEKLHLKVLETMFNDTAVAMGAAAETTATDAGEADDGDYAVIHDDEEDNESLEDQIAGDSFELTLRVPHEIGAETFEFVWCPPGSFDMGSINAPVATESPRQQVSLTKGFWIGKYPVTRLQYKAFTNTRPMFFFSNAQRPATKINWNEANAFCSLLSSLIEQEYDNPMICRLPTEAQWEYACRAGTESAYSFGNSISSRLACYEKTWNSPDDVGKYPPNAWGIYDMHGTVWEWCRDGYRGYSYRRGINPIGYSDEPQRMIRGGGFLSPAVNCRSSTRAMEDTSKRCMDLGFRLILEYR